MLKIFGIPIDDLSLPQAAERIEQLAQEPGLHLVVTANPEILLEARRNKTYWSVLKQAALRLADGIGVIMASHVLGSPHRAGRVTGVDLVDFMLRYSRAGRFFLIGENELVLNKTTQIYNKDQKNYPIVGYSVAPLINDPYLMVRTRDNEMVVEQIIQSRANIILVAMGHPKQELWITTYLPWSDAHVGIGVGGALDYLSGFVRRPPRVIRFLGLEWLWRLLNQPRRLIRIFRAVILFPAAVLIDNLRDPGKVN